MLEKFRANVLKRGKAVIAIVIVFIQDYMQVDESLHWCTRLCERSKEKRLELRIWLFVWKNEQCDCLNMMWLVNMTSE